MHASMLEMSTNLIEKAQKVLLKVEETNKDYEDLRMKYLKLAEERDLSEAAYDLIDEDDDEINQDRLKELVALKEPVQNEYANLYETLTPLPVDIGERKKYLGFCDNVLECINHPPANHGPEVCEAISALKDGHSWLYADITTFRNSILNGKKVSKIFNSQTCLIVSTIVQTH